MNRTTEYRFTAIVILVHVLILLMGFNVLAMVFEFPEVLRQPADYRLTLFMQNSAIVIPTYYLLALTGFTQILMAVMLRQLLQERENSILTLATLFGVLAGLFQVLGFIRWPILIPYIAGAMEQGVPLETVAFIEGAFNHYLGMTVGEHLGFLAQAIWTTLLGVTLLNTQLFDRRLAWPTIILGLFTLVMGLEPLSPQLAFLGELTVPVHATLFVIEVIMAVSLLRTDAIKPVGMKLGWRALTVSVLFWVLMVGSTMLG